MARLNIADLKVAGVVLGVVAVLCHSALPGGDGEGGRFASERDPARFAGATKITLTGFDASGTDVQKANLQLDKNEVAFSAFGDPEVTAVFYKPFPVEISRLKTADPLNKNRRLYSMTIPKEHADDLGKNSLRLVVRTDAKSKLPEVRILLVGSDGKVIQARELRPN
jgi:hypothetical protein